MAAETIVALSTAPGMGAIGVIRLSGPESFRMVLESFTKIEKDDFVPNKVYFGVWKDAQDQDLDEVLVCGFKGPRSYTGEDVVEISCHGSPYIIGQIISQLTQRGAVLAQPGEFTMRAYLNGKMDLSQAEAVADLIASETKAAHRFAVNQLKGGIRREIQALRGRMLHFLSMLELELDFGEEDVEFADRTTLGVLFEEMKLHVQQLLESFQLGQAVRTGIYTVIAGKPNAGKSTLLNCLLGDERALVSDIPGTTRDTVEEKINIHGILFHFIDTAGLRESTDVVEQMGIRRTHDKIRQADILVYVFDPGTTSPQDLNAEIKEWEESIPYLVVVANKSDLYQGFSDMIHREHQSPNVHWVTLSAKNEAKENALTALLYQLAVGGKDLQSQPVAINARHEKILTSVLEILVEAEQLFASRAPTDLLAQAMRRVAYELGGITGEISSDELLGNIFGKFCIGK